MIAERRNELKNTGYEIFIAILSVLSIVNIVLDVRGGRRQPRHGDLGDERPAQRHLPRRLRLPAPDRRLEVRVLHPPVRLGRPPGEPALPPGQGAPPLPADTSRATAPHERREEDRANAARGPGRERAAHPRDDGHPRPGVREPRNPAHRAVPGRCEHHDGVRRARGTSWSPSRPSATATASR